MSYTTHVQYARILQQLEDKLRETESLLGQANAKLDAIPEIVVDKVTEYYESPCDPGLLDFVQAAGLKMPNRHKNVKIEWTEVINYYAEDTVECAWDGDRYVPTDVALDALRDSACMSAETDDFAGQPMTVDVDDC
jgi:hypothetical protein